jgi:peroxiredoxin (alkyl hydroperoxide reductase subunit C)
MGEFEKRGVQVLGVSMDDAETHARWRETAINDGGIGPVGYPLIADTTKQMSKDYDVVHEGSGFSARGTYLIDPDGICWHAVVNNLPLGRDIDELLRAIDGVQFFKEHGEVCPAGWATGKAGMAPSDEGVKDYLTNHAGSL